LPESQTCPLVSIVIPVYNGANFLAEAIESALAQTWPNIEIIVVDDGSDDDGETAAVAASFGDRIRYDHKPNGGVATAVNRGVSLMRGEYFSWLSHDDVYAPEKTERLMEAVLKAGEPVIAFGDFALMSDAGEHLREFRTGSGFESSQPVWAILEGRLNGCAMMIPKVCFAACGYLRPDLPSTQDYDLWFRMALKFQFIHVPGIAVFHRQHDLQGSKSPRFRSETDLLFLSVFDRLTDEVIASHAPSKVGFYKRVLRTLGTPGTSAALGRVLQKIVESLPVAALIHTPESVFDVAKSIIALRNSGTNVIAAALPNKEQEEWTSLTLARDDGAAFCLKLVPAHEKQSLQQRLGSLVSAIDHEFVWLTADGKIGNVSEPLAELVASPEAAACVLNYVDGRLAPGPAAVLEGAVVRTQALRLALAQSTGSLTSLVHALSRLGPIKAYLVPAEPKAIQSLHPALHNVNGHYVGPPPQTLPPVPLTPVVLMFAWLNRYAVLSKLATEITWRWFGSGARARDKLLKWNGLTGWIDEDWYRRQYRDVIRSGVDPVYHFLMFGYREGRDPSPEFSIEAYRRDYKDVASATMHPVQHYVLWGRHEGRQIRPTSLAETLPEAAIDGRPAVLIVLPKANHSHVMKFALDLADQISPRIRPLYLCGLDDRTVSLGSDALGKGAKFELPFENSTIVSEAQILGIKRVIVLHRQGFRGLLGELLQELALPFDVVHLDYDMASGGPDLGDAVEDLDGDGNSPRTLWNSDPERRWLIENVDRQFALSRDSAERLVSFGISDPIIIAPPPDPHRLRGYRVWARPAIPKEPLRIALFGSIDPNTGIAVLFDVLAKVRRLRLPLQFFVFGELSDPLPADFQSLCKVVNPSGAYALTTEVCHWHPHLAWFPYQTVVPFGHEMTDAQASGLPIAASAIGAVSERLERRPLSWLLPWDSSAQDWIALFLGLRQDGMSTDWSVSEDAPGMPNDHRLYQRHLYDLIFGQPTPKQRADEGSVRAAISSASHAG
jgi:glycosyltransferase involved in cell wall biosynthesis